MDQQVETEVATAVVQRLPKMPKPKRRKAKRTAKKRCPRCRKMKAVDEFPKSHFKTADGRRNTCKPCVGKILKEASAKAKARRKLVQKVQAKVLLDQPASPPRKARPVDPVSKPRKVKKVGKKLGRPPKAQAKVNGVNGHGIDLVNVALKRSKRDVFTEAIDALVKKHVARLHHALATHDVEIERVQFEGQEYAVTYRKTERFAL